MAESGVGGAARYVAFISYSHRDAAIGRWLHRKLESYRLPRRLAGSDGEHGPVPARLIPIFRDRDELPAAGDLSERVRAALAISDNLIVICSPNSAASPWVAKEIETFRALHPGRPVFAAIVEGDPAQCFPPALSAGGRIEPLAADLRKEGDGRRLGVLKLVAGLTGVGLDALVQRDAQRHLRRVTAVTLGAVAGMVVMAVLTILALSARAEAERQRAEAEGLVEFMLTDLRDRLRGVGRLDAMAAVNARALSHYGVHGAVERLPNESLARRARVLHAIGDDNLELDDYDSALKAFEEAEATTAELVARAPNDPRRLFEHTKSLYGIGQVHELRREWKAARQQYYALAAAASRLLAMSPSNPDYLMKGASAAVNLGNLKFKLADAYPPEEQPGQYAAAERYYREGVRLLTRADEARAKDPHILMAKANALAWLADSYFMRGMRRKSLDARLRQNRIMDELHRADAGNADFSYRLAVARYGVARSHAQLDNRREARIHLLEADRLTNGLVRRDACNAKWRSFRLKLDKNFRTFGLDVPSRTTSPPMLERHGSSDEHFDCSRPRRPAQIRQ